MFDYIIIGAGTSGSVVANRLVHSLVATVLLLEAGGMDDNPKISVPGAYQALLGSDLDWKYQTEKEPFLLDRHIPIERGKVVGGCSSINAMVYVRGHPADYDSWQSEGWDFPSLLPFFEKLENDPKGSLKITTPETPHQLSQCYIKATAQKASLYRTTISNGKRCSAADAFLRPLNQSRFTLETDASVSKILFENNRAVGVEYQKNGKNITVRANKEVILCAGALNSPALLMRSGVGDAKLLEMHHIPLVKDLPGVGKNLQDHLWVMVTYQSHLPSPHQTSNGCEAGWFTQSSFAEGIAPDLQMDTVLDLDMDPLRGRRPTFSICPILLHPKSRGEVSLHSADPAIPPKIQMNYLAEKDDMLPLLEGIILARSLAASSAFKGILGEEILPGKDVSTEEALRNYIREKATTLWHPVGTCRMGSDPKKDVVDSQLKIHGLSGIRVIDASIMPTIPSGNTQASCYLIGEKGADLIIQNELRDKKFK